MTHAEDRGSGPFAGWRVKNGAPPTGDAEGARGQDPETGLSFQSLALSELGLAPWRTLNTFGLTPAPLFDPVFLRAISAAGGEIPRLLTISDPGKGAALKAVWPYTTTALGPASALSASMIYTGPYAPASVPIVARGGAEGTIKTALHAFRELAPVLVIPNLPLDSDFAQLLTQILKQQDMPYTITGRGNRAVLHGGTTFRDYALKHWSRNRRNKIRRLYRRLSEVGPVTYRSASTGSDWPEAGEIFLELESRGWKGQSGTALAARPETRRIVDEIVARLIPSGLAEIHGLLVGDKPIAMLVLLRQRRDIASWKTAYDEDWSQFSPGHLLFAEVTQKLIARGTRFADSCSTDASSVADAYWGDRMEIGMLHIGLRPGAAGGLGLRLSAVQTSALDIARSTYRKIKGGAG